MSKQQTDEIKRLYFETTAVTIERDLKRAIEILKTLETEDERERVAVYMDGLSQMRSEWALSRRKRKSPHQSQQKKP